MEDKWVNQILGVIGEIYPQEVSIAIADRSKFIYYKPSMNVDLKIRPGDDIKEGSVTFQALTARRKISQYVDQNIYGVPYYGMSVPLINHGNSEGCVTAIFPEPLSQLIQATPKHQLLIGKWEERWIPIPFSKINFIHTNNGKTYLYTDDHVYLNKYTLTELQMILPTDQFIRCHRAFIVNIHAIEEIHPDFHSTFTLVLKDKNKSEISVSQTYASHFRKHLGF